LKRPSQKRAGGVVQGAGPEFKPCYCKNKTKTFLSVLLKNVQVFNDFLVLALARQVLYHLSHTPSSFSLVYFSDTISLFFGLG
jgi:hypothetical protein